MKKKEKKHDKIAKSTKCGLNDIKVLISKALIDSNISHEKNVMIWKKNWEILRLFFIEDLSPFIKKCYCIIWKVEKIQKVKVQNL